MHFYVSRPKELDSEPKSIQQIEFIKQLIKLDKNSNTRDADNDRSMFFLTILEKKLKETKLRFSQESIRVL